MSGADVAQYKYDPPIGDNIHEAFVSEIDEGLYDVFDDLGRCWNEGCMLPFIPTQEEVKELILTGKIKGKVG